MQSMHHQLLCIDEGRQRLALVDTVNSHFGWTLDLAAFPCARDLQRLDTYRALVGYEYGFFELDLRNGTVLKDCRRWHHVSAVYRENDGSTLITGYNLDGQEQVNLLRLDTNLASIHQMRVAGNYVRLMRKNGNGGYLLCMNDHILETDQALVPVRRLHAPGFQHAWMAQRFPDGSTLVSAGYGAFMARFNPDGEVIHIFGQASDLPSDINPFFYASFQLLPDGRVCVANWQGHGPDNGHKGRQLLEFSPSGNLLGSWSDPLKISSLQGILIL